MEHQKKTQEGVVDMNLVIAAAMLAVEAHHGQVRKYSGLPYVVHPLHVGALLASAGVPEYVVAAGILHDVIEDTDMTYAELSNLFGSDVATLVLEVTSVSDNSPEKRAVRKAMDADHYGKASPHGKNIKVADMISNAGDVVDLAPLVFAKLYVNEAKLLLPKLKGGSPSLYGLAEAALVNATLQLTAKGGA